LKHPLSISAGLARYHWQQPASLETLMEQADQAMYAVKQSRRKACKEVPTRPRGKHAGD
jgi:GGDEF domain-containing protein